MRKIVVLFIGKSRWVTEHEVTEKEVLVGAVPLSDEDKIGEKEAVNDINIAFC